MHCRPSELYGIERSYSPYVAYCFDSAVIAWGTAFENDVQNAVATAKSPEAARAAQGRVLRRWVDVGPAGYADPAARR